MAETNNNMAKQSLFQTAPAEIIAKIAGDCDDSSLRALRQTSKSIEKNTFDQFESRITQPFKVELSHPRGIQNAINLIKSTNLESKVTRVEFTDRKSYSRSKNQERDPVELFDLLKQLFDLLPSLNELRVHNRRTSCVYRDLQPSVAIEQTLRALSKSSAKLTSLELNTAITSADILNAVLTQHKNSLTSVNFKCIGCENLKQVLEHIQSNMSLDKLQLAGLYDRTERYGFCLEREPNGRYHRGVRNPVTQKLEHYSVSGSSGTMMGSQAVKDGIAFIVLHMHVSRWYL